MSNIIRTQKKVVIRSDAKTELISQVYKKQEELEELHIQGKASHYIGCTSPTQK